MDPGGWMRPPRSGFGSLRLGARLLADCKYRFVVLSEDGNLNESTREHSDRQPDYFSAYILALAEQTEQATYPTLKHCLHEKHVEQGFPADWNSDNQIFNIDA